jgi:hypothetical protein
MYIVGYVVGGASAIGHVGITGMKIFKISGSSIFWAAGLTLLCASANAAVIPVVDPDFDQFPTVSTVGPTGAIFGPGEASYLNGGCGIGCHYADNAVIGWNATATFQTGALSGQWETGLSSGNNLTFKSGPENNEPVVERAINAALSQTVGVTAQAGVTYSLNVDLVDRI